MYKGIRELLRKEKLLMRKMVEANSREDVLSFNALQEMFKVVHAQLDKEIKLFQGPALASHVNIISTFFPEDLQEYFKSRVRGLSIKKTDSSIEAVKAFYFYEMFIHYIKAYKPGKQDTNKLIDKAINTRFLRSNYLTNYFLGNDDKAKKEYDEGMEQAKKSTAFMGMPFVFCGYTTSPVFDENMSPEIKLLMSINEASILASESSMSHYSFSLKANEADKFAGELAESYLRSKQDEKQNVMRL